MGQCDCFRENYWDKPFFPEKYTENWYYYDPKNDNVLIYIQKFGKLPLHGHWNPENIFQKNHKLEHNFSTYIPDAWNYTWAQGIREHLGKMDPKLMPTHLVFNQGLWTDHDLIDPKVQDSIIEALNDTGIKGIYKTTTELKRRKIVKRKNYERDICNKLGKGGCLNLLLVQQIPEFTVAFSTSGCHPGPRSIGGA